MKKCPVCGDMVDFSTYFGGYICDCGWEDRSFDKERHEKFVQMISLISK